MPDTQVLPGWFRGLFVITLAALCALLAFFAVEQYSLRFQIDDLTLKLDTSRQRETKQTYEYNQVSAELPLVLAELEQVEPLAKAAKDEENRLRQERKAMRTSNAALQAEVDALQAEYDELVLQAQSLQESLDALHALLND